MNHFTIEYLKICRDCLAFNGATNIFSILGDEKPYLKFTEMELAEEMHKEEKQRGICCWSCHSNNHQIYDTKVRVDNIIHRSYDFEKEAYNPNSAVFYMVVTSKNNGISNFKEGGRNNTYTHDKLDFIKLLKDSLLKESSQNFVRCHKGDFSFVASAKFDDDDSLNIHFQIEKFYHTGYTKDEIFSLIEQNSHLFQQNGF